MHDLVHHHDPYHDPYMHVPQASVHISTSRWTSHGPVAEMEFGDGLRGLYYFLLRIYVISCIHENEYDYELKFDKKT